MSPWPYLVAFALTLLVEVPLYVGALTGLFRLPWRRALVVAVLANAITHPALWWTLRPWTGEAWYPWLLGGAEAAVCAVEWLVLAVSVGRRRAGDRVLLAAVVVGVNGASVLAGAFAGRMI